VRFKDKEYEYNFKLRIEPRDKLFENANELSGFLNGEEFKQLLTSQGVCSMQ
jgi:hypothetical protein